MKLIGFLILLLAVEAKAGVLKINGSTTVNLPVAEAAEILRETKGMEIQVDTQGGSSGGISGVGDGLVQIGMSSKPLSDDDRKKYPAVNFHVTEIGADAVALVVSPDVWNGAVHALSKDQIQALYEGRTRNWKEVGGPDRRVVFFNKEPGRGTWEVFAHWLYGDSKKAPLVNLPEVGGNEETRSKVASTRGAVSQLSASWADNHTVYPLSLVKRDGDVAPSAENIASGKYPMSRGLFLITNGEPEGDIKTFVDFMLSPEGQKLVEKHGYLPLAALGRGKARE